MELAAEQRGQENPAGSVARPGSAGGAAAAAEAPPGAPFDLGSLYNAPPEADSPEGAARVDRDATETRQVFTEIKRVIVGQDHLIERLLVALLARGHILLEGVPGLAKTLAIKTVAQVAGGTFRRIQFTPDLVPADLVGTRVYNQRSGEFGVELGPVFANLLLADEINRAPAKVQSALLEVMQGARSPSAGRATPSPIPFSSWPRKTPSRTKGRASSRRPRSIASCSRPWSATQISGKSWLSSTRATEAPPRCGRS